MAHEIWPVPESTEPTLPKLGDLSQPTVLEIRKVVRSLTLNQHEVNQLALRTPSGDKRNALADASIYLGTAITLLLAIK